MTVPLLHYDYLGAAPNNIGLAHPSIAPYGAFTTLDGHALVVAIQNDREWANFAEHVLEDTALANDPRFATNAARVSRRSDVDAMVARRFASASLTELADLLSSASIAFGRVNDVAGLSVHPQLRRVSIGAADGSTVRLPAHPVRGCKWPIYGEIPSIGQHSAAIREEFGAADR